MCYRRCWRSAQAATASVAVGLNDEGGAAGSERCHDGDEGGDW